MTRIFRVKGFSCQNRPDFGIFCDFVYSSRFDQAGVLLWLMARESTGARPRCDGIRREVYLLLSRLKSAVSRCGSRPLATSRSRSLRILKRLLQFSKPIIGILCIQIISWLHPMHVIPHLCLFCAISTCWTRQTLSGAWEATNWDGLGGAPWQMVTPELMLTNKVTADSEGADPHCQGLWSKERRRLSREDSTFCLRH